MRQDPALITRFLELFRHGLGRRAIFLWSDSHTVVLAVGCHDLAQKSRVTLLTKIGREPFRILLLTETAKLHGPHAR